MGVGVSTPVTALSRGSDQTGGTAGGHHGWPRKNSNSCPRNRRESCGRHTGEAWAVGWQSHWGTAMGGTQDSSVLAGHHLAGPPSAVWSCRAPGVAQTGPRCWLCLLPRTGCPQGLMTSPRSWPLGRLLSACAFLPQSCSHHKGIGGHFVGRVPAC